MTKRKTEAEKAEAAAARRKKAAEKKGTHDIVDLEPFQQTLMVPLTESEIRQMGRRLARCHGELKEIDEQLAEARASAKAAKEPVNAKMRHLIGCLDAEAESRPVQVRRSLNFTTGKATLVRLDTGQVVQERPMNEAEMQKHIASLEAPE